MKARTQTSFLFDLDGTLVDCVYDHVLAWHDALLEEGFDVSVWRLHRKIGMSGGLFTKALARETGREFDTELLERLRKLHAQALQRAFAAHPASAGREGASRLSHRQRHSLGHRHLGAHGNRRPGAEDPRRRSDEGNRHHARPGALCQA